MLEADTIAAERRTRRSLRFWRIGAVLAMIFALAAVGIAVSSKGTGFAGLSDHVARVRISGLITGKRATLEMLRDLAKSERVRAVIVHVDSPGGTIAGSEALYVELRKLAKKKPVVSVMGTVAASGGYIAAIATDHIVARGNTITGSIGVIFQWAQLSKLFDSAGIEMRTVKSGELKAVPNMFEPLSDKAKAVTEAMVQDSYRWFTGLVEDRRPISAADVTRLSDGRVYTGRQALAEKLIDAIGGEAEARQWLAKKHKIAVDTTIVDWKPGTDNATGGFGMRLLVAGLALAGLDSAAATLARAAGSQTLALDGLMAVWHPALSSGGGKSQ